MRRPDESDEAALTSLDINERFNSESLKSALDLTNPVERVFYDLITIMRERSAKYTHGSWDDNFVYTAKKMREYGFDYWTAVDSAQFLEYVKDARQDAALRSGRTDFEDDSYRDSDLDSINYKILKLALKDTEDERSYE